MSKHKNIDAFKLIAILFVALLVFPQVALSYTYQSITYSDSTGTYNTYVRGISGSTVVGYYIDHSGNANSQSFTYNNGTFTGLSAPGSLSTTAYGIDGANIVGVYFDYNGSYGFKYDGTNWASIVSPSSGIYEIKPNGISGSTVVGSNSRLTGWDQGFAYDGTNWTVLSAQSGMPPQSIVYAYGIDGANIVGYYQESSGARDAWGYLFDGANWTYLDVPNALNRAIRTFAYDIDGDTIVGSYQGFLNDYHGFVYENGIYTSFDYPGAKDTWVYGIDGTSLVGYYKDMDGSYHGFLATSTVPEPTTILFLGLGLVGIAGLKKRIK